MKRLHQTLEEIKKSLAKLTTAWEDELSTAAIEALDRIPIKKSYSERDIATLLDNDFKVGKLLCRLFLGLSMDQFEMELHGRLGKGGTGVKRYQRDPSLFLGVLIDLGLPEVMTELVNRKLVWSDILVERLRSGRGKAIRGQRRGRGLEDFTETLIEKVFGSNYDTRCQFLGANGEVSKCDFAIPSKAQPCILVEVKGYGATGSKMTDIIGDLNTIIRERRHDTILLFLTDGITWLRRLSDLEKIVAMQNQGKIARIYTTKMTHQLSQDLEALKVEHGLG